MNNATEAASYASNRVIITKITMLFFIGSVVIRTLAHTLPFQLCNPILIDPKYDLGYILFVLSGLAHFFAENNLASFLLSALVIVLPFLIFLWPTKNKLAILFAISWIFMAAMQGVYGQHNGYLLLSILLTVPFCVSKNETFSLLWEGLRYYGCWVYASTFLLKLINGAFWQWDYGAITLSEQTIDLVYWLGDSWHAQLATFFNQYPTLVNIGQKFIFLIEGAFIIGFFTKKYDKMLLIFAVIIFIATTLFAMVFFIENLIIYCLIFIKPERWKAIQQRLGRLNIKYLSA